jgi:hypothetical protein
MGGGHVDGAGKVVQYVETSSPDAPAIIITSTDWVSTGIIVSITPKFIGSKICVDFKSSLGFVDASGSTTSEAVMSLTLFESGVQVLGKYGLGYLNASLEPDTSVLGGQGVFTTTNLNPLEFTVYCKSHIGTVVYPVHPTSSYVLSATEIAQ